MAAQARLERAERDRAFLICKWIMIAQGASSAQFEMG
jgi:hypothetical protein